MMNNGTFFLSMKKSMLYALSTTCVFGLTGCTLDTIIESLMPQDKQLITSPSSDYVELSSVTLPLTGFCDTAEGSLKVAVNSVEAAQLECPETGIWTYELNLNTLPEGEANLTVQQRSSGEDTAIKTESVILNKDISAPALVAMPDVLLNDKGLVSWDCQNPNDKCKFRSFISATDLFVFAAEPYTNLKSNMTFPDGKSYLFLQAKDAAGNVSPVTKVEVYSGPMGIWINPMQMKLATSDQVTLRFYIPQVFTEYTLFNNDSCSGANNWQARPSVAQSWNLSSATPGTYNISARFRTATGTLSQCFTDSIPLIDVVTQLNICTAGSSNLAFGVLNSSKIGQTPGYENNENCTFTVNATTAMDIVLGGEIKTEADKDILTIRQGGQILFTASGSPTLPLDLSPVVSTQPGNFTFNFSSDAQNGDKGFSIYWMPKKSILQEITLNNKAAQTSSKVLQVTFDVPAHLKEYYLTEDNTCTAGGTWKTIAAQNTYTSAIAGPGTITVYGRFRDLFGNESECVFRTITYAPPNITIASPSATNLINNSLDLGGACSDAGATVRISGTFNGETTCSAQNDWSKSFSLASTATNATVTVTAELVLSDVALASANKSYTLVRYVTPSSPTPNGYIGTTFTLSGTCAPNGSTINVTSPIVATATCTNEEWSVVQTVSGNDGDIFNIAGNLTHQSNIEDSFSYQVTLSTLPPAAVVSGVPAVSSVADDVLLNVSGVGVSHYKYKVGKGITCSSAAGYSAETSIQTGLFVNQTSYAEGDTITLCVVGKSEFTGLWQDYSLATTHAWQKASFKYANISKTSQSVNEGQSNVTFAVSLSEVSSSAVRIYYQTAGDAIYMLDHNLLPGYIEIPAGQVSAQITFNSLTNPQTKDSTLALYLTHTNKSDYFIGQNFASDYVLRDPVRSTQKIIGFVHASDNNPAHSCALTEDGILRCWGTTTASPVGVLSPLPAITFTQVVGNRYHFCALSDQKDLYCAGYGNFTATNYDPGVKYKSIALKQYIGCGITTTDRVRCWSMDSSFATLYIDDGIVKFKKVAPSHGTTCAISLADDLYCYGNNVYKTIANNSTTNYSVLTLVDSGTKYSDVTAYTYICGIHRDTQQLRCWGRNDYYQNGNGTNIPTTAPEIIDGSTKYLQISGSNTKACGLTENYQVKCWGKEIIGLNTATQTKHQYTTPTLLQTNLIWKSIQANEGSICGIADDDLAYCFGDDTNYRNAVKGELDTLVKVDSAQYTDYNVVSNTFCGIRNDGSAMCSGYINSVTSRRTPQVVQPSVDFTGASVLENTDFMPCISTSTASYCTRSNYFGHLGDGTNTTSKIDLTRTGGMIIKAITGNTYCAVGVDENGDLKSWGYGSSGASTCPNTLTYQPLNIKPGTKFKPMLGSFSTNNFCALSQSNEIYCWGAGSIMRGTTATSSPTSVDSDYRYTDFKVVGTRVCGILETTGQIRCWGNNSYGQLGNNSTGNVLGSMVHGGNSYNKLDMNDNITCALRGATLDCWGGTATHNSLVPFTMNGGATYKDFAVSSVAVLAVTTGGEVHIWDNGLYKNAPRTISPAGLTFNTIKAPGNNTMYCALTNDNNLYCRNLELSVKNHLRQIKESRF